MNDFYAGQTKLKLLMYIPWELMNSKIWFNQRLHPFVRLRLMWVDYRLWENWSNRFENTHVQGSLKEWTQVSSTTVKIWVVFWWCKEFYNLTLSKRCRGPATKTCDDPPARNFSECSEIFSLSKKQWIMNHESWIILPLTLTRMLTLLPQLIPKSFRVIGQAMCELYYFITAK